MGPVMPFGIMLYCSPRSAAAATAFEDRAQVQATIAADAARPMDSRKRAAVPSSSSSSSSSGIVASDAADSGGAIGGIGMRVRSAVKSLIGGGGGSGMGGPFATVGGFGGEAFLQVEHSTSNAGVSNGDMGRGAAVAAEAVERMLVGAGDLARRLLQQSSGSGMDL